MLKISRITSFFCHVTLRDNNAINYFSDCTPFVLRVLLGHIANCQVWELAGKLTCDQAFFFFFYQGRTRREEKKNNA